MTPSGDRHRCAPACLGSGRARRCAGHAHGFSRRGSAKKSIGRVFQDRAARYPDHVFIRFDDEGLTYREANETVNRYAATLAERGVGRGDVVGVIMHNSARTLLVMLAAVKLGAIAGMLNHKQRGNVLAHSVGLLHAKVIVGEDLLSAVDESEAEVADTVTIDELDRLSADAPTDNPAVTSSVLAKDRVLHLHLRHHRRPEGQCHDALPVAARDGWVRRHRHAVEEQRHRVLLPAAVHQRRADRGGVGSDQRRGHSCFGPVVFGLEVLGRHS